MNYSIRKIDKLVVCFIEFYEYKSDSDLIEWLLVEFVKLIGFMSL